MQVNSLREIQALKRLSPHPNIVKLYEVLLYVGVGALPRGVVWCHTTAHPTRARAPPLPPPPQRPTHWPAGAGV